MSEDLALRSTESPRAPGLGPTLRACQHCALSKSKCVPATDETGGKCARCFKSHKDCVFPLKSSKKRKSPTSTTAELEERVQSLAALLASQQAAVARPPPPTPDSQNGYAHAFNELEPRNEVRNRQLLPTRPDDSWANHVPLRSHPGSQARPNFSLDDTESTPQDRSSVAGPAIPPAEGDYLLRIYRDHFSRRFPFVVIPKDVSAREFKAQKPWLFRAVTIVASQDSRSQQLSWAKDFMSDLAVSMIVHSEKSLDMLQGLVIYNAWSYSFASSHASFHSTAPSQLAIAMVFDLGLNRTISDSDSPVGLGGPTKTFAASAEGTKTDVKRSMDERRTLLSVYFLTNMLSWTLKRIEGLQYSPYLEYCRCSLLEFAESESDIVLAALVKIQSIIEKSQKDFLDCNYPSNKVPIWMYSNIAALDLQGYWATLSHDIRQNTTLLTNYYSAEISLLEPALTAAYFVKDSSGGNVHRIEMLHKCLTTTKRLMDHILAQPISDYFTFSILEIASIGHGCPMFLKLSLVEDVGWDLTQFRQDPFFREYFRRLKVNMEQVGAAIDQNQAEPCKPSFFTMTSQKMDKVKGWYEAKIGVNGQQGDTVVTSRTPASLPTIDDMRMFDDRFWDDFMLGGTFF